MFSNSFPINVKKICSSWQRISFVHLCDSVWIKFKLSKIYSIIFSSCLTIVIVCVHTHVHKYTLCIYSVIYFRVNRKLNKSNSYLHIAHCFEWCLIIQSIIFNYSKITSLIFLHRISATKYFPLIILKVSPSFQWVLTKSFTDNWIFLLNNSIYKKNHIKSN